MFKGGVWCVALSAFPKQSSGLITPLLVTLRVQISAELQQLIMHENLTISLLLLL